MTNHEETPARAASAGEKETAALAEELRQARLEIVGLRVEASRLALQVDDMRRQLKAARTTSTRYADQIGALRGSISWRLTRPLRVLRRRRVDINRSRRAD